MTAYEWLDLLFQQNNGIVKTAQVLEIGIAKSTFYAYTKQRGVEQAAHGVYVSPDAWTDAMYLLHQIDWRKRIRFPGARSSASHIHRTHSTFLGQDHGTSRSCLFIRHMCRCNALYFCDISAIHRSFHSLCSHRLP